MENRDEIERLLDLAYAARQKEDAASISELFTDDARFIVSGAPQPAIGRAQRHAALAEMFSTFALTNFRQHCRVIDPPRAVVHWHGRFQAKKTGKASDVDILDLFEFADGRISSLSTFFDTAHAVQLLS
jgi:uncharacterized protein (TIGR02246 family)